MAQPPIHLGNPPPTAPQAQVQPQIQPQMPPNATTGNQGSQHAQSQQQCGCAPGHLCQQHTAALNPIVRCVRFLACWDCGPIGTIIAAGAFAAGTVLTFYAFKLAIWTATKDYIEHCQSDVEANRATRLCLKAASQELSPPPFYEDTSSSNSTFYRRTLRGLMLGATESRTHTDGYVWGWAVLWHAISWLFMSKICHLAWNMAGTFRFGEADLSHVVREADIEALLDRLEAAHGIEHSSPVSNGRLDDDLKASSSGAAVKDGDNTSELRSRRRVKPVELAPRLFMVNTACRLVNDPEATAKSLEDRGAFLKRGRLYPKWHPDSVTMQMGIHIGISVSATTRTLRGLTLRKAFRDRWNHSLGNPSIHFLRNLYGLEISACTGNARRISIVDVMMTSPFQHYLRSFPWTNPLCRRIIMEIIEDHDADGFINCYIENPDWRKEISQFITACLDILDQTGVDASTANLTAFWMHGEDPVYVEFPAKLYPWVEILKESTRTFTMAVLTNTCLSTKGIPHGKTCTNGRFSPDQQTVLETQILTGGPEAQKGEMPYMSYEPAPKDSRKFFLAEAGTGPSGCLEILKLVAVPHTKDHEKFCIATWKQMSRASLLFLPRSKRHRFYEELGQVEGVRPYITYVIPRPRAARTEQAKERKRD